MAKLITMPTLAKTYMIWQIALRLIVGGYWLFFSSQKWIDISWVKGILDTAARGNYVPVYGDLLRFAVSADWGSVALGVTFLEALVGVMILIGLLTRVAAVLGAFTALNLTLTFAFCNCPWSQADFLLVFWFYFAPFLLNVQLIFDQSSDVYGIQRMLRRFSSHR